MPRTARSLIHALLVATAAALTTSCALTRPDPVSKPRVNKGLIEANLFDTSVKGAPTASTQDDNLVGPMQHAASEMVLSAMSLLGVPYRHGGSNEQEGFDCSGFTRYLFERNLGMGLPRRADDQAHAPGLVKVSRENLRSGDLVFFNTLRRTFSHVGIYVGGGKFIHAPSSGGEVRLENMQFDYWAKRFTGARRAVEVQDRVTAPALATSRASLEPAADTTD